MLHNHKIYGILEFNDFKKAFNMDGFFYKAKNLFDKLTVNVRRIWEYHTSNGYGDVIKIFFVLVLVLLLYTIHEISQVFI